MALLAMDGFESGTAIGFSGTDAVISTEQARTGTYSAKIPAQNDTLSLPTITIGSGESVIVGFALYATGLGLAEIANVRRSDGTDHLRLSMDAGGNLIFGNDTSNSGPLTQSFGTSTGVMVVGWNYIEMEWLSSATVGIARLWLNGNLEVDISTGDTQAHSSGADYLDYVLEFKGLATAVAPFYVDDYYALDTSGAAPFNTALGAVRIELLTPDGSVESDFVGSDADSVDNHLLIDDVPMDTTDYIESATATNRALHGLSNQTLTGTPLAIKTMVYGRDSDGGSQAIDILTKSDLTERATSIAMGVSDNILSDIITLDPDGDVAWTESQVNALQVGVEVG